MFTTLELYAKVQQALKREIYSIRKSDGSFQYTKLTAIIKV